MALILRQSHCAMIQAGHDRPRKGQLLAPAQESKSIASVPDRYQSSVALAEAWRGWRILSADMTSFFCPYLVGEVQLSGEREAHIAERHPDLLPEHRERIGATLADPNQVRRSPSFGAARSCSHGGILT